MSRRLLAVPVVLAGLLARVPAQDKTVEPAVAFKGHAETVYAVALSADDKLLATASFDKTLRLWNATDGTLVREFGGPQGHTGLVLSVDLSPKADVMVSGGADTFARVWDVPTSVPRLDLAMPAGVAGVAVGPESKLIAAAGVDGSLKLWSAADAKVAAEAKGTPFAGVGFAPNGSAVATVGTDEALRFWNPADGKPLGVVGAHAGPAAAVALTNGAAYTVGADGLLKSWQLPPVPVKTLPAHGDAVVALVLSGDTVLTAAADKSLRLSNFGTAQAIRDLAAPPAAPLAVALNAGNTAAAAGLADGRVALWNAGDGKTASTFSAHAGGTTGIAYHPDAKQLVTAGADGVVRGWNLPVAAPRPFAHPDAVTAVAQTADGKRLLTAGADKLVRSWTVATGAAERQFAGAGGAVKSVAISSDGTTFAAAGADEFIRFWTAATSAEAGKFAGHVGPVNALSIQGSLLASGGDDGTVKLWQLPPAVAKSFAHPDAVTALVASLEGTKILTISGDKQARLWNAGTGATEKTFATGQPLTAAAPAPDGATVALASADKTLSIRAGDKELKKLAFAADVGVVAYAADGKLVAGLADGSLKWIDAGAGKETKSIAAHAGAVVAAVFAPKGDLLATAGADKAVKLWAAADGTAKGKFDLAEPATAVAISRDGQRLAAGFGKSVAVWTLADSKPVVTLATPAEVKGVALSPDGLRIAAAGGDGKVRVYGSDGKLQEAFAHAGAVSGVAFLADGKKVASSSADKTAAVWSSSFLGQAAFAKPVRGVALVPQGDRVVVLADDGALSVVDAKSMKPTKTVAAHGGAAVALALGADGTKALTAGIDKNVRVWTVADGAAAVTFAVPGVPQAAALSPNGTRIAVAHPDGQTTRVTTYDAASGKELQAVAEPAGVVRSLAFQADNRTLIVAGDDKTATAYDAAAGVAFPTHAGGVVAMQLHPAGTEVVTAGRDKTVKLWQYPSGKEVRQFGTFADSPTALAASKDFAAFAAAAGKALKVWQADGKELLSLTLPSEAASLAFSPDRKRVLAGCADNVARVYDIEKARLVQWCGTGGALRFAAFHGSQPAVVIGSADKTATIHPLVGTQVVAASTKPLRAVVVNPATGGVIVAGDDGIIRQYNPGNAAEERKYEEAGKPVTALAVAKNGLAVAAAHADKQVRLYGTADGKIIGTIEVPAGVRGLAYHPTLAAVGAACDDKSVRAWNVAFQPGQPLPPEFGKPMQTFPHADVVTSIAFADNGDLVTGSLDKTVKRWKLAADAPTRSFQHPDTVDAVALDPVTANLLATGCHDGSVRIYDIAKNAVVKQIAAHTAMTGKSVYAIAWTPDGKQIASASQDQTVKLWDAAGGNLVREFKAYDEKAFPKGHRNQVFCLAFSKDGQLLATGGQDRSVKLWKVADGSVVREFVRPDSKPSAVDGGPEAHPGGVYGVRFTPDGKSLVTVGHAPKLKAVLSVWDVADGKRTAYVELPTGPAFGLALTSDGTKAAIASGPKERTRPESEAVIVKVPGK